MKGSAISGIASPSRGPETRQAHDGEQQRPGYRHIAGMPKVIELPCQTSKSCGTRPEATQLPSAIMDAVLYCWLDNSLEKADFDIPAMQTDGP